MTDLPASKLDEMEAPYSVSPWCRDMSKAPCDGREVLVECFDTEERFVAIWSHQGWRYAIAEDGTAIVCEPDAWLPLAELPSAQVCDETRRADEAECDCIDMMWQRRRADERA